MKGQVRGVCMMYNGAACCCRSSIMLDAIHWVCCVVYVFVQLQLLSAYCHTVLVHDVLSCSQYERTLGTCTHCALVRVTSRVVVYRFSGVTPRSARQKIFQNKQSIVTYGGQTFTSQRYFYSHMFNLVAVSVLTLVSMANMYMVTCT